MKETNKPNEKKHKHEQRVYCAILTRTEKQLNK